MQSDVRGRTAIKAVNEEMIICEGIVFKMKREERDEIDDQCTIARNAQLLSKPSYIQELPEMEIPSTHPRRQDMQDANV